MKSTIAVLLDEEYGYRTWVWETGMIASELEAYWTGLPSVLPFFHSIDNLPGDLMEVTEDLTDFEAMSEKIMTDKFLSSEEKEKQVTEACMNMPIKLIRSEDGEPVPEKQNDWWRGHIHMDDDSWLRTPTSRRIYHAGFSEEE